MARKKKKKAEEAGGDSFMTLFTALSVILLAFFIFLNSMATMDVVKKRKAFGSLIGSFGILPGAMSFKKDGAFMDPSKPLTEDADKSVEMLFKNIETFLKDYYKKAGISFAEGRKDYTIRFKEGFLFTANSADIVPSAFPLLDLLGKLIKEVKHPILVQGHTDDSPPPVTSSFSNNWELSAARAVTIVRYLNEAVNVPDKYLTAEGMASYHPIANNLDPNEREKNRRVEIIFNK